MNNKEKQAIIDGYIDSITFTGEPFLLEEGISIQQKKVREIISNKLFNALLMPFLITTDYFFKKDTSIEYTLEGFFKLDEEGKFMFQEAGVPVISYLLEGLKYFFNTEEVNLTGEKAFVINKKFTITKHNFDEIAEMIARIYGRQRIKELVPPEGLTEAQKDIWIKTMRGRKKKAERDSLSLYDIVNVVIHFDNGIRYNEVMDLTTLQLYNSFNVFMKKDKYDKYYKLYSSGQFEIKKHEEHWINTIRKNYKEID